MSKDLRDAVNTMNALPDIDGEDSERLREFVRVTTREVEVIGGASAGTTLEMIGYIRELEHKLNSRASVAAVGGDADSAPALCAVHQRIEDAGALECEVGNDCVACSLNERRELLQLIAPFAAEGNTEDSVTVMRRVAEFYATHVGEGRVIVSYPAAASSPAPAEVPQSQHDRFRQHLDEASAVVATWEPWERNIFGDRYDETATAPAEPEGEQEKLK